MKNGGSHSRTERKTDTNNAMKVVLLGSEGMLGVDMHEVLREFGHEVLAYTRDTLNITDGVQVAMLAEQKPNVVINCAAYTNVDGAEDDCDTCMQVNAEAVERIAQMCAECDAVLVQISTDYVFDGEKGEYDEDDTAHPLNVYGASKAEAETLVRATHKKHYIVRTAWLYGENGKNFVQTVQRVCKEKGEMRIVNDQVGSPTYTKDLARAIVGLFGKPYGTYHITNTGICSWYEFAREIVASSNTSCTLQPCTSAEYPQKALRPKSAILRNTKVPPLRPWQEALADYLQS